MSFETWFTKVDVALNKLMGCTNLDLPDQPYWAYWDDGLTPRQCAMQVKYNLETDWY